MAFQLSFTAQPILPIQPFCAFSWP